GERRDASPAADPPEARAWAPGVVAGWDPARIPEQPPRAALRDLHDRPRRAGAEDRDGDVDRHDRPRLVPRRRTDRLLARRLDSGGRPRPELGAADVGQERLQPRLAAVTAPP